MTPADHAASGIAGLVAAGCVLAALVGWGAVQMHRMHRMRRVRERRRRLRQRAGGRG